MKDSRKFGEENGRSKLTENDVRRIRENPNGTSQRKLAIIYGVNRTTNQNGENYTSWPHVR